MRSQHTLRISSRKDTPWSSRTYSGDVHIHQHSCVLPMFLVLIRCINISRSRYYWLDNFAINQHERTSEEEARQQQSTPCADHCWRKSSVPCSPCHPCIQKSSWAQCGECQCAACRARSEDLPDWDRMRHAATQSEKVGFERVIQHTRSTLMLMEPWDQPRAPTRVWCLFEGNCTLQCGGTLEAVRLQAIRRCLIDCDNLLSLRTGPGLGATEFVAATDGPAVCRAGQDCAPKFTFHFSETCVGVLKLTI